MKSRLEAQNYEDRGASGIPTKGPTVNRYYQRIDRSIAASLTGGKMFNRDITQSYVQDTTELERTVCKPAPTEMGLDKDIVLRVVKPLFVIPESGIHLYLSYL